MKDKFYFPALTGIRYIAAFMVCLFHSNPFSEARFGITIHNFFNEFHVGVTFFFVLSGFLIAIRYYNEPSINFKKYFINRVARIYPLYIILTSVVMLISLYQYHIPFASFLKEYLLNITFLRGFFDNYKFTGILQGWSLTVEETFYMLAPMSFLLIKKNKWYLLLLPIVFTLIGIVLVMIFSNVDNFGGFFNTYEFLFSYTFFGRVFEFFIGIILAILYMSNKVKIYTIMGIVCTIFFIYVMSTYKNGYDYGIRHPMGKIINNLLLPIFAIAPLYLGLIKEHTILQKMLSTKVFDILGKCSFALYLIHIHIIKINSNFIFVIFISTIVSIVLYLCVEEPLNKIIRKFNI
jgi:peptidoglycan/LPS O-acetylase OafA/YrhL